MDIMNLLALLVAGTALFFGVPDLREHFVSYVHVESFILVFFGTLASTIMSTSTKEFREIAKAFYVLFIKRNVLQPRDAVAILVRVSELAQTGQRQQLVDVAKQQGDPFLDYAIGMLGSGLDREFIQKNLETDMIEMRRRHLELVNKIRTMGTFAPMFGIAGTVLGIVEVLRNVEDTLSIVSGMSLGLLSTFYGVMMTSIFFIPLSNKAKTQSDRQMLTKEIIAEGILAIYNKEIPLKIRYHLNAYLDSKFENEKHG